MQIWAKTLGKTCYLLSELLTMRKYVVGSRQDKENIKDEE